MRIIKKRSFNRRKFLNKSFRQGKILGELKSRSGYVTIRSLTLSPENTDGSLKSPTTTPSTKNSVLKKTVKYNGTPAKAPTQAVTVPDALIAKLNAALINPIFKNSLKNSWKRNDPFSNKVADFISYPFKVVTVHQLLNSEDYLEKLTVEVSLLSFHTVHNDLHNFKQTRDLFEYPVDNPALYMFLSLLEGPLLNWVQDVSGKKLSGKITVTGSKYSYTNYLLCHDDNLSDRSIAFILYLSKDWNVSDGGALQLFKCNDTDQPISVVHSIYPAFGSFAFFEVTSKSYHHVQEILSKDKVRLSINGWFHGNELPVKPEVIIEGPQFKPPISPKGCSFKKWINPRYLVPQNHADIKSDFGFELSVSLPEFLQSDAYYDLEKALRDKSVVWKRCGPAHQKNYEKAKFSTLPPIMQNFLKLLRSKYMFYFLSEVTVDIHPDSKTTPLWYLEVQRWSPGDYSLAVDNDPSSNITGIDVHLYFNVPNKDDMGVDNCGTVCYLGPDKDSQGFLEQNAEVEPEKNALFLVAHIAGMKRVTEYINHDHNMCFHKIVATYCQGN